jgi:protein Mpv17
MMQHRSSRHRKLRISSFSEDFPVTSSSPIPMLVERSTNEHQQHKDNSARQVETISITLLTLATLLGFVGLTNLAGPLTATSTSIFENAQHVTNYAWENYMSILTLHPISTKACTSGAVYAIGDVISQQTESASSETVCSDDAFRIDSLRVLRSSVAGFIGHGPMSHFWYVSCDNFFENIIHMTEWWAFLPKIVVDQTIWGPIWNNSYILLIGLMRRESINKIVSDVKSTTIPLVVSGLKLWPAAHLVTYGLIPIENRLLWVDLVEILWVTILSSKAASLDENNKVTNQQEA